MTNWRKYLGLALAIVALLCLPGACSKGTVSDNLLDEALTSGVPTLAGFVGEECGCKDMRPTLEVLAAEYQGRCNIVIVDVISHKDLAGDYEITLTPTQVFLDDDGQEMSRHVGFWSKEDVIAQLAELGIS